MFSYLKKHPYLFTLAFVTGVFTGGVLPALYTPLALVSLSLYSMAILQITVGLLTTGMVLGICHGIHHLGEWLFPTPKVSLEKFDADEATQGVEGASQNKEPQVTTEPTKASPEIIVPPKKLSTPVLLKSLSVQLPETLALAKSAPLTPEREESPPTVLLSESLFDKSPEDKALTTKSVALKLEHDHANTTTDDNPMAHVWY